MASLVDHVRVLVLNQCLKRIKVIFDTCLTIHRSANAADTKRAMTRRANGFDRHQQPELPRRPTAGRDPVRDAIKSTINPTSAFAKMSEARATSSRGMTVR